jgi:uncharacterized protein (DUF433 family)
MNESELRARVTIDSEQRGGGEATEQILADYPYLEAEDITASLLHAARQLDHPILAA